MAAAFRVLVLGSQFSVLYSPMPTPVEIAVGDVVQTRKPHPCGGDSWTVVRIGAEIGMRCTTCQHKVFLPRATFERPPQAILEPRRTGVE